MTTARRNPGNHGVSSVETLVSAAISLLVIGALWGFFSSQQRALAAIDLYGRSQNVTRSAIDLFGRDLRMAGYDPTDPPGTVGNGAIADSPGPTAPGVNRAIIAATATRLRFQQDLDGNGVLAGAGEDVTWDLLGGQLRRTDGAGTPVELASGLASDALRFRYFDGSNPPIELVPGGSPAQLAQGQRDTVAKVQITIRARLENPDPQGGEHLAVAQSEVAIRSRSLNNF